jgi:beta-1,2-mannobiose phosphorylase / 1,2-beta-oligomannan phosphorylase
VVQEFNPSFYTSGGGWYGCEDPRAVIIGDRVYLTYTAFGGWHSVRMAYTSISLSDFKKGKWNWKRSRLISPYGEVHKNWVLFPEKIHGKFAVLHSLFPRIRIDYVDTLESLEYHSSIKSTAPKGGFTNSWDNAVRGAGPPPIKTKDGWLLLYHAMDKDDPNKYKVGAMLLDLNNPSRITHKAPHPLLAPDMHYENDYKPGVVYVSGAVVKNGTLYMYYGGGDKHLCVAEANLNDLLTWLKEYGVFTG